MDGAVEGYGPLAEGEGRGKGPWLVAVWDFGEVGIGGVGRGGSGFWRWGRIGGMIRAVFCVIL